jgi:hypothetical protein
MGRLLYVCEGCEPEVCGWEKRESLRVTPDGRWLCEGCFSEEPCDEEDGPWWNDCFMPPEYILVEVPR